MRTGLIVALMTILYPTLFSQQKDMNDDPSANVILEITYDLAADWESLDADEYLNNFSRDLVFYFAGNRMGYDELEKSVRISIPALAESTFEVLDPRVSVIGKDHGVISFELKETFLDEKGSYEELEAAMTLVWRMEGQDWKVVMAHESLPLVSSRSDEDSGRSK